MEVLEKRNLVGYMAGVLALLISGCSESKSGGSSATL